MNGENLAGSISFWHIVRVRFDKAQGLLLTLILALVAILTAVTSSLYIGVVLFVITSLAILIWTFYRVADDLFNENVSLKNNKNYLPPVFQVMKEGSRILCFLKPSDLFSYNAAVTFYYYHENYERPVGLGEVVNIQDDGIIQVELASIFESYEDIVERFTQNNSKCLERIRVKPVILKRHLEDLRGGI